MRRGLGGVSDVRMQPVFSVEFLHKPSESLTILHHRQNRLPRTAPQFGWIMHLLPKRFHCSARTRLKGGIARVIDEERMAAPAAYLTVPYGRRQDVSDQLIGRRERTRRVVTGHVPLEHVGNVVPISHATFSEHAPVGSGPLLNVGAGAVLVVLFLESGS